MTRHTRDALKIFRVLLILPVAAVACRSLVDPPLPAAAVPFAAPAEYSRWWAMTESCSGLTGSLASITWYTVPGSSFVPLEGNKVVAYWSQRSNRVVIAEMDVMHGGAVRHEMLHALKKKPGHPRADFVDKCGSVVVCAAECALEGSASTADAGTPRVPAVALTLTRER